MPGTAALNVNLRGYPRSCRARQLKEGLDFPEALEFLARRAGIELQREDEFPGPQSRRARRARELEPLDRAAAFYAAHAVAEIG